MEATVPVTPESHVSQLYPLNVVLVGSDEAMLSDIQRNLANSYAYIEGQFSDIGSAMTVQPGEQQRLFIALLTSAADIANFKRLTGLLAGQPFLAVVAADTSREALFGVMRAGAMQIVSMPMVDEDFKEALNWFAVHFGTESKNSFVVAVAGATGGCGATTLSANIAYELALSQEKHCILTEVGRMGHLASYLDITPRCTTRDVFANLESYDLYTLRSALTRVMDHLDLLPGNSSAFDRRLSRRSRCGSSCRGSAACPMWWWSMSLVSSTITISRPWRPPIRLCWCACNPWRPSAMCG